MSEKIESPTVQEVPADVPTPTRVVDWTIEEEKKAKRKQVQHYIKKSRYNSTNKYADSI